MVTRADSTQTAHRGASRLPGPGAIVGAVRPDAWFTYRLPKGTREGFVEADRGNEVWEVWLKKQEQYAALFTGDTLYQAIGFRRGWMLAVTETPSRAKQVASWLTHGADPGHAHWDSWPIRCGPIQRNVTVKPKH